MQRNDPISRLSEQWMEIEAALPVYFESEERTEKIPLLEALDGFQDSLSAFVVSDIYRRYTFTPFSLQETMVQIRKFTAELHSAIAGDRDESILFLVHQIHRGLAQLQSLNTGLADAIGMSYFFLFFIFTVLFAFMVLVIWRLSVTLEHSVHREQEISAFFQRMILGQEQERARVARELHDTAAQDLRRLGLNIARIGRELRRKYPEYMEAKDQFKELMTEEGAILNRLRAIIGGLVPPDFHNARLPDALAQLCHDFGKRTGIECRLSCQEGLLLESLSAEMQLQCFRLVQESLHNIEKHAHASEAVVVLRNSTAGNDKQAALLICISDDGCGFAKVPVCSQRWDSGEGSERNCFGIRGMYERTAILGGELDFISAPGEGTMVRIVVPLSGK
jgi:signal transduction histidine kinase